VAKLAPIHPGEVLLAEFLEPHGLSQYRLARDIGVPARRVNEIVLGKRGITADTALRLSRYFGTSDRFWLDLQVRFDLETERDRAYAPIRSKVQAQARRSRGTAFEDCPVPARGRGSFSRRCSGRLGGA
jgi:antitoxin HigA-1